MKIYVIGDIEQARAMLENNHQARTVNHCAATHTRGVSACSTEIPDWIVIEGNALTREGMALIQSLRAMDFSSYRSRHGTRVAQDAYLSHGASRHPPLDPAVRVFEYQAPPRRRNN